MEIDHNIEEIYKRKINKKEDYIPITSLNIGDLQCDLIDMSKFFHSNSGVRYLEVIIDVYSRFAWIFPIKHKTPEDSLPGIRKAFSEVKKIYPENKLSFSTDDDSAFKGVVKKFLSENNIEHYISNPKLRNEDNTMIVERLNYTFLRKIFLLMRATNETKYLDFLPKLVNWYNNKIHSTIKMKPIDVFENKKRYNVSIPKSNKIKIGSFVRILLSNKPLQKKARNQVWSNEIYIVLGNDKLYRYQISKNGMDTEPISYLARQLKVVKDYARNVEKNNKLNEVESEAKFKRLMRQSGLD